MKYLKQGSGFFSFRAENYRQQPFWIFTSKRWCILLTPTLFNPQSLIIIIIMDCLKVRTTPHLPTVILDQYSQHKQANQRYSSAQRSFLGERCCATRRINYKAAADRASVERRAAVRPPDWNLACDDNLQNFARLRPTRFFNDTNVRKHPGVSLKALIHFTDAGDINRQCTKWAWNWRLELSWYGVRYWWSHWNMWPLCMW